MIAQLSSMMLMAISLKCGRCGEQLASAFTTSSKNIITSRQQYYGSPTLSPQSTRWRSEQPIISHSAESDVHIIVNHTEIIAEDESLPSSSSQRETILNFNNIETPNTQPLTLPRSIDNLPRHIAFICDGNSRWARNKKSIHKSMGHVAGADRVVQLIQTLSSLRLLSDVASSSSIESESSSIQSTIADTIKQGGEHHGSSSSDIKQPTSQRSQHNKQNRVEYCTLYAFSTENWSRPQTEISTIFKLIQHTAIQYQTHYMILDGRIQIEVLGNLDDVRIPNGMRDELNKLVDISKAACDERRRQNRGRRSGIENENDDGDGNNDILTIGLAINYGGRSDILQAATKLAQSIASGEVTLSNNSTLNESLISERLSTSNIPDPDLIIRTGGEQRLSNFLLWNVAYSELYFSDLSWPDFDNDALKEALSWYGERKRRFGGRE